MTTSSYSNERLFRALLICCALSLCGGCSDDTGDDTCGDEAPPPSDSVGEEITRQAQLRLESRTVFANGQETQSAVVTMALVDLSLVEISSRFPSPCCGSLSCFSLTGAPYEACRGTAGGPCGSTQCSDNETCVDDVCEACARQPLDADSVVVDGLAGGQVTLERTAVGAFSKADLPTPLFGSEEIAVDVSSHSAEDFFPAYQQSLTPPDPLELQSPDPRAASLVAPSSDMDLKWNAGNGDWVEVSLRSSDPTVTDTVVCIARDDGCATIPIGAFEQIRTAMKPDDKIELTVRRYVSTVESLETTTAVQIKASTRVDLELTQN